MRVKTTVVKLGAVLAIFLLIAGCRLAIVHKNEEIRKKEQPKPACTGTNCPKPTVTTIK